MDLTPQQKALVVNSVSSVSADVTRLLHAVEASTRATLLGRRRFEQAGGTFAAPVYSPEEEQRLRNLLAGAAFASAAASEALAGRREILVTPGDGSWSLASLAEDPYRVALVGSQLALLDPRTGTPTDAPADGQLGVEPITVVVTGVAVVAVAYIGYMAFKDYLRAQAEANDLKQAQDAQTFCQDMVTKGKMTPAECDAYRTRVREEQIAIINARTEQRKAEEEKSIASTVQTALWVALGLGVIALGAYGVRTFSAITPSRRLPA